MRASVLPSDSVVPGRGAAWRDSALWVLDEAKGAASLSLIAAVGLSLAGQGHGWQQWLSLLGIVAWIGLRKSHLL